MLNHSNTHHCARTPYNLIDPQIDLIPQQNNDRVLQILLTVHNLIFDQLKIAQFNVGEKFMLNTQNLKLLNQHSKKFRSSRCFGP